MSEPKPWDGTVADARVLFNGRITWDAREPGYCGSVGFDHHCKQLEDPEAWVHSSVDRWRTEPPLTPEQTAARVFHLESAIRKIEDADRRCDQSGREAAIEEARNLIGHVK